MLGDFNYWFRRGLEFFAPGNFTDSEVKTALIHCYEQICEKRYNSGTLFCPLDLDDVGAVILSYIAYFTKKKQNIPVLLFSK